MKNQKYFSSYIKQKQNSTTQDCAYFNIKASTQEKDNTFLKHRLQEQYIKYTANKMDTTENMFACKVNLKLK